MTRGEFEKLAERYKTGACTQAERALVEKWVESNCRPDEHGAVFENEEEVQDIEDELWENIRGEAGLSQPAVRWWAAAWWKAGLAASVAIMVLVYYFSDSGSGQKKEPTMTGLQTFNTSLTDLRIVLPDSSVVTLGEGASIITSESYGNETRAVRLTGEAFFEVRPNLNLPFLVYSGDLVTEVLGTTFKIKPEKGKKTIEVSVVEGKVSVYTDNKDRNERKSGVIILPNQKVVYDPELKTIRHDLVDEPKMIVKSLPESAFRFDETSVGTVLDVLHEAYGMEIVVSNPELRNCEFTGNLDGFDLFKQLRYICDAVDASYEVRGATVFLKGRGCDGSLSGKMNE